jgi:hypothetical protein
VRAALRVARAVVLVFFQAEGVDREARDAPAVAYRLLRYEWFSCCDSPLIRIRYFLVKGAQSSQVLTLALYSLSLLANVLSLNNFKELSIHGRCPSYLPK